MSDPLQSSDDRPPLFGTQHAAGEAAARSSGAWRRRLLARISEKPSSIFELAEHFEVTDNRISGRISDLQRDGYIEPTGEARINPNTGCKAEVWQIRRAGGAGEKAGQNQQSPCVKLLEAFPLTIRIDNDLYDRQQLLPRESYPGIPYARRADTGGVRQVIRVELIECPGCGKPLFLASGSDPKRFTCGNPQCGRTWRCRCVAESGKAPMLALVMEEIR